MKQKSISKNLITLLIMFAVILSAGIALLSLDQAQTQLAPTTQVFADTIDWSWNDGTVDGEITYKIVSINSVNTLLIKKYFGDGAMSDYNDTGPWGRTGYTKVVIADDVTTIGELAFFECINITEVTIPNSVETIGDNAFYRCSSLKRVNSNTDGWCVIPESVTYIGENAFHETFLLKTIIILGEETELEYDECCPFFYTYNPYGLYSNIDEYKLYIPDYYDNYHDNIGSYGGAWSIYFGVNGLVVDGYPEEDNETGVFVDIILPTMFVGAVFAMGIVYIKSGKKKKLVIG